MRAWSCCLVLALAACSIGDDTADGSRAQCAEGGALNDVCVREVATPEQACWRLVDCGAIPVFADERYELDWDRCVEQIQESGTVQERLIMACVSASTCDQLKLGAGACLAFGDN